MKHSLRWLLSSVTALVISCGSASAEPLEIQQHWQVGKKYFLSMHMDQQMTINLGTQKVEQATDMTMETSMAVTKHEDGVRKRITLRYERTAMQLSASGQKFGFDSAKPGEGSDPMGLSKTLGATVGKEVKMLANEKDEITEIENFDELVQQIGPSTLPGFDVKKLFDKEALTQAMRQGALQATPGKPVEPGASWPFANSINMPQIGKVTIDGNYTFKQMSERGGANCAEIAVEGMLKMDLNTPVPGSPSTPEGAAALQMKVTDGTIKGTLWFDPKVGMAREVQMEQEMTLSMKNPLKPEETVNVPMKQTITNTLTKVEDVK